DVNGARIVSEGAHTATAAGSGGLRCGESLALERFALVGGASDEHGAAGFAVGIAGLGRVPGHIDIALRVGCYGAAAVETVGISDYVTFGFEGCAGVIQTG